MDKRIKRTHDAIKTTFEELVLEDSGKKITVSLLAQRANINRKTFYLHYDDIEDLKNSYVDEISDNLVNALAKHSISNYIANRGLLLDIFANFFIDNRQFYSFVLTNDNYSSIARLVQRKVSATMANYLQKYSHCSKNDAIMITTFITTNMITMLQLHLTGVTDSSRKNTREWIVCLTIEGLQGLGFEIPKNNWHSPTPFSPAKKG
ncbi:transcriptional regulator [Paucilactobacillus hokkaidonensis JCM 18461]|uniref:Transcriptional regulator n=2 Tax=Paucilactobacillus hokkaidonensis TaxID=1193095 RepID=A0A0A1GX56_9LACO|nr:TetR/AcrR family transcriptional regulator [Paucilactobacillus hokkaidonensis]KRO10410.1 hypothetical protein IV59_GL001806 [Paucilactobacillus hokkaidonensis]BAP86727.1 transcriptional regulator [Paucilactobacillus hokkaidonensis JCM 18461]